MGLFEEVKMRISVPAAAERYGLEVKRGGMALCPFHQERHPSMKLYEDHFYCFGCGKAGDVVTLTAGLLGLGNYEAAMRLREDFWGNAPSLTVRRPDSDERRPLGVVNRYIRLLKQWQTEYAPQPGQEIPDRFTEALQMLPQMEDLSEFLTYAPAEDRRKAAARLIQDRHFLWLEKRMKEMNETEEVNERNPEPYVRAHLRSGDGKEAL